MNYRPILFSGPMVRAILEGRKTQTRRIAEEAHDTLLGYEFVTNSPTYPETWKGKRSEPYTGWVAQFSNLPIAMPRTCRYGAIGDLLWVREEHYAYGHWAKNGATKTGKQKWKFIRSDDPTFGIYFFDTKPEHLRVQKNSYRGLGWYKRLGRFMPRKYCRIFVQIEDIKAERLQDISEADCLAEGIVYADSYYPRPPDGRLPPLPWKNYQTDGECLLPIDSYSSLWKEINGEESWSANPWVWALTFKRIDKPADFNKDTGGKTDRE